MKKADLQMINKKRKRLGLSVKKRSHQKIKISGIGFTNEPVRIILDGQKSTIRKCLEQTDFGDYPPGVSLKVSKCNILNRKILTKSIYTCNVEPDKRKKYEECREKYK